MTTTLILEDFSDVCNIQNDTGRFWIERYERGYDPELHTAEGAFKYVMVTNSYQDILHWLEEYQGHPEYNKVHERLLKLYRYLTTIDTGNLYTEEHPAPLTSVQNHIFTIHRRWITDALQQGDTIESFFGMFTYRMLTKLMTSYDRTTFVAQWAENGYKDLAYLTVKQMQNPHNGHLFRDAYTRLQDLGTTSDGADRLFQNPYLPSAYKLVTEYPDMPDAWVRELIVKGEA